MEQSILDGEWQDYLLRVLKFCDHCQVFKRLHAKEYEEVLFSGVGWFLDLNGYAASSITGGTLRDHYTEGFKDREAFNDGCMVRNFGLHLRGDHVHLAPVANVCGVDQEFNLMNE